MHKDLQQAMLSKEVKVLDVKDIQTPILFFFFGGKGWGNEKVVEAMLNQSASSVARLDMW